MSPIRILGLTSKARLETEAKLKILICVLEISIAVVVKTSLFIPYHVEIKNSQD